ncbi:MAG TPA: hypothetical protein PLD87_04235 [Bacteroidia bacterium]|nr:hypothetical protein [Bacteroidia bacterium]
MYYQLKMFDTSISIKDSVMHQPNEYFPENLAKLNRLKAQNFFRIQDFSTALMLYKKAFLINYMKSTANNLLEDSGVNYSLHFPDTEISSSIHPEIKRNIFLVMKEAINNSLKYANAKNITVTFTLNKSNFKLIVADDGNGFDVTDFNKIIRNGNGLINMQQRMFQHQNKLTIISTPGHGCKIVAEGKQI